jgi:aspartyl/asparaginyl beta-hydroxylase (cupin superfamily)
VTHASPTDPRLGAGVSEETPGDTSRFLDYVRSFEGEPNDLVMGGSYPRLPSITWYDPAQFPITAALENHYDEIREEVLRLSPTSFHRENECIGRIGEWEVFWLFELGEKNELNCSKLPVTTAVIESHGAIQTIAGLIYISKMRPGTHISPHRGPTNIRVRCHLGIQVPEGDCAISIGGEKKHWREGRCLLLDDHQEHEAWNHTQFDRIVLIVDVWHPDLSSQEISLLKGLHKYAYVQSSALAARRQRNASFRADPPNVRSDAVKSLGVERDEESWGTGCP